MSRYRNKKANRSASCLPHGKAFRGFLILAPLQGDGGPVSSPASPNRGEGHRGPASPSQGGQMIVELMVASSILIIGMLGIFAILSQSLGLNKLTSNQYIAANLAAEGIELVKNIIDTNDINAVAWNSGVGPGTNLGISYSDSPPVLTGGLGDDPLRYDPASGYQYDSGDPTQFKRAITITNIGSPPNEIGVVSEVSWNDRRGARFDIVLEDVFRDWRL